MVFLKCLKMNCFIATSLLCNLYTFDDFWSIRKILESVATKHISRQHQKSLFSNLIVNFMLTISPIFQEAYQF